VCATTVFELAEFVFWFSVLCATAVFELAELLFWFSVLCATAVRVRVCEMAVICFLAGFLIDPILPLTCVCRLYL